VEAQQRETKYCDLYRIAKFVACVQGAEGAQRITDLFLRNTGDSACRVEIVVADNVEGVRRAGVIILTCPPDQANIVLSTPGMHEALAGKLLISMLGGVSVASLQRAMYVDSSGDEPGLELSYILRAISNVAAAQRKSLTIIGEKSTPMPNTIFNLAKYILGEIGDIIEVRPDQMTAATALCASGTAFFALFLEAAIEGAVSLGIDRSEAVYMAAHTMAGAAELTLSGDDPTVVRDRVTTPGGSTARGLRVMAEAEVKDTIVKAFRATASAHETLHEALDGISILNEAQI
jgi:pyrroline-5-carboxylate reductase